MTRTTTKTKTTQKTEERYGDAAGPVAAEQSHLAAIVDGYRRVMTPKSFMYWLDSLCLEDANAIREHAQQLIDEDQRADPEWIAFEERQQLQATLKATLSESQRADLDRLLLAYGIEAEAERNVMFRIGMAIGGAR